MTKEYEIGINLLKKVQKELGELLSVQDKVGARRIVNSIIDPVTASAYQIRVGNGPHKEEFLEELFKLIRQMRDLSDMNTMKESVDRILYLLKEVEQASPDKRES